MHFVSKDRMKPLGIVGALIGAVVGALAWGLIAWKLQVEIGYVAWGIGLLVGFLSYAMGGRGMSNGVVCAVVALISMFVGKMLAVRFTAGDIGAAGILSWGDYATIAKETLGLMDIVFGVLGLASAFQLGGRPDEDTVYTHQPVGAGYQPPMQSYVPPVDARPAADADQHVFAERERPEGEVAPPPPISNDPIPADFQPADPPTDPTRPPNDNPSA